MLNGGNANSWWNLRGALALAGAFFGLTTGALGQNAADPALTQGEQAVAYVQSAECPNIESRTPIPGLETRQQQLAELGRRWNELVGHLQAANQLDGELERARASLAGQVINERTQRAMERFALDTERSLAAGGVSFAAWWIAIGAHMREINPEYPPSSAGAHPLAPYVANVRNIETLLAPHRGRRGFDRFLAPTLTRYVDCLYTVQKQVVDSNEISIRRQLEASGAIPELLALRDRYDALGEGFTKRGEDLTPLVMRELETKRAELQAAIDRERNAAARAEFEREQARKAAQEKATLDVARRFVSAANRKDTQGAKSALAADVILTTPRDPPVQGRDQVMAKIQGGGSKAAPIEEPDYAGSNVAQANTQASGRNIRLMLTVEDGFISQIDVRQR